MRRPCTGKEKQNTTPDNSMLPAQGDASGDGR